MTLSLFEQAFGTKDLYSVLFDKNDNNNTDTEEVPSSEDNNSFSPSQLRKAYYKKAKQYHPDRQHQNSVDNDDAKRKFQAISWAYSVLKDPKKRELYDTEGIIDEFDDDMDDDNEDGQKKSWKDYFDLIFGKVSTSDIDSFAEKYKMSDEEEKDVLQNYVKFKGNLKKMLGFVMLSEERDVARWIEDYIQPAIDRNEVENYEKTLNKTRAQVEKKILPIKNNTASSTIKKKKQKQNQKNGTATATATATTSTTYDDASIIDPDETETETEESEGDNDDNDEQPKNLQKKKKVVPHKATKSSAAPKAKIKKQQQMKKKKSNKASSEDSLIAAIRNKNRGGGTTNPFASIAAKYGVSAVDDDDNDPLDDAQFEKLQSKYKNQKGK